MKYKILDAFTLKLIMVVLMVLDHIAQFIPNSPYWLHWPGRLVAPVFFYLLTEGYKYTSSKQKYMKRLFTWAGIMFIGNIIISFIFKRKIPLDIIFKSYVIAFLAMAVVCFNTLLLCIIESNYTFIQVLFEVVSAFGTVGLSTGITPNLTDPSKFIIVVTMFIGRVGPFTLASVWAFKKKSNVTFSEEGFTVG